MLKKVTQTVRDLRSVMFLAPLFILMASSSEALGGKNDGCPNVTTIGLNTTTRGVYFIDHQPQCFEAFAPGGIMFLDAAVSSQTAADAKLAFHGRILDGIADNRSGFVYLERSAASMLIEIRVPGSYLFCVTAQDPEHQLAEFKLKNGFVSGAVLGTKDGDPEEDEPPPDPFGSDTGCDRFYGAGMSFATKDGDPEEDEPPPDPKMPWGFEAIREALCLMDESDDHGDARFCATPLIFGDSVSGEIKSRWADDDDYFVFVVSRLRTVHVETMGQTDTFGGLYDHLGYRIAVDDDGGNDDNFRIVKTLSPGLYYVRVGGRDGQEGSYRLNVETRR